MKCYMQKKDNSFKEVDINNSLIDNQKECINLESSYDEVKNKFNDIFK